MIDMICAAVNRTAMVLDGTTLNAVSATEACLQGLHSLLNRNNRMNTSSGKNKIKSTTTVIDSTTTNDVINENNIEILTTVDSLLHIKNSIEEKFLVEHAELTFKADNYIKVEGDIADKM